MLFTPFVYTSTRRERHTFNGTLATLIQLKEVIKSLETHNVTASNLVLLLLQDNRLQDLPCTQNLINQADEILQAFYEHPKSSKSALTWASDLMKSRYAASVRELANKENGWHFGALRASAQKLQEFRIENMAQKMEELAPELWDLLGLMLSADKRQTERIAKAKLRDADGDQVMGDAEEDERDDVVVDDVNIEDASNPNYSRNHRGAAERREALVTIVSLRCIIGKILTGDNSIAEKGCHD